MRRQIERERAQQDAQVPHADVLRPAAQGSKLPELPDEQPCFVITEIALLGPDVQRLRWLTNSTDSLLNRCIGAQGISRIAAYLDAQLIEQGYVTSRVALGSQNLADGRLEFRLHAGRVASIRMVNAATGEADDDWGTWRNAFPTSTGALLNVRDLEQGVEQMKRLPSQAVATTLTPGASADTSVVTIERKTGSLRERIHGGVTLDNSGTESLGRTQASASVALDNPLGLNDLVGVSLNSNAEEPGAGHRTQGASLNYSIPFGYSTFNFSASHSRVAQRIQLTTSEPLSRSLSDSAEIKWQHTAWRTASAKTGVYASLSNRRAASFLDDTELTTSHRKTTFVETGINFRQLYEGDASIELELGYRRGMPWLSAQDDLAGDPQDPSLVPTLRPRLWTFSGNATVPLGAARRWLFSASVKGQFTHDHTTSIDQIAIGNRSSVRGFDGDAVLLAENGWFWRNELSTPLPVEGVETALYFGLDYGHVWGPSDAILLGHDLAGAALGVRGRFKALQFDLALAAPVHKPEGFNTSRTSIYASATYGF